MDIPRGPVYTFDIEVLHGSTWVVIIHLGVFQDHNGPVHMQAVQEALEANYHKHQARGSYGVEHRQMIYKHHTNPYPVLCFGRFDPHHEGNPHVPEQNGNFHGELSKEGVYLSRQEFESFVDMLPADIHYCLHPATTPLLTWAEMALTAAPVQGAIGYESRRNLYRKPIMDIISTATTRLQERQADLALAYKRRVNLPRLFARLLPSDVVGVILEYASPCAQDARIVLRTDTTWLFHFKERRKATVRVCQTS